MAHYLVWRSGIKLIENQSSQVLLSYFGQVFSYDFELNDFPLAPFNSFTENPRQRSEIVQKFRHPLTEKLIDYFYNHKVLVDCSQSSRAHSQNKDSSKVDLLTHFYKSATTSESILEELKNKKIQVIDLLGLRDKHLDCFSQLGLNNISCSDDTRGSANWDYEIILASRNQIEALEDLNQIFIATKRSYLLVMMDQFGGSVGPHLGRLDGPCFECFKTRIQLNSIDSKQIFQPMSTFSNLLIRYAALECYLSMSHIRESRILTSTIEFDFYKFSTREVEILPLPRCAECNRERLL